jgi:IS5 family transposase
MVFHLPSRQTEGFMRSLFALLNLANDVPDHTTICRRKAKLGKTALTARQGTKPVHILIDSSGLKVHVGQLRSPPRNRDYRKLHLAVDETSGEVLACALTSKIARDAAGVPSLVGSIDKPIASARADSGYDKKVVYDALEHHREERSPRVLIPP